jgi:mevalonate kinase
MADELNARQLGMLAQQALENQALVRARDELRADCVEQALQNTDTPEAEALRRKARTMLEGLELMRQKLETMVEAGKAA